MGKHIPERMCAACRKMYPKRELIRIVKTENGAAIDEKQKLLMRGIYLCRNEECIKLAQKKRVLERFAKGGEVRVCYERAMEEWIRSAE